jgi:endonuclease III
MATQSNYPKESLYRQVYLRLLESYGEPTWRPHLPPVDELVSTILSQNTSDTNRDMAFEALKLAFPTWQSVANAPPEEVVEAIRPAGLANQKGPRIQAALRQIEAEQGLMTLDFLRTMPLDEARNWLTSLNGVGPKTAAIVLLFALGRPAFPVDTHVHRVTRRLGLIAEGLSAEKAHEELERLADPQEFYAFHLNLIRHGRQVCKAREPRCEQCRLTDLCDFYRARVAPAPSGLG